MCHVDGALQPLTELPSLKILNLAFSSATGKAIRIALQIPTLVSLRLEGCKVTDDDVGALSDMPQLANLYLGRTQIGDSQITEEGLSRLSAALPKTHIMTESIASTDLTKRKP